MKYLFALIGYLFLLQPVFAQEADSLANEEDDPGVLIIPPINEKIKLGVKLGCGLFMMGGEEANNPYPIFGLTGGGYLRYRFNKHWALQTETNISIRGGKFDNKVDEYGTIRTYYADVPILLMYGLNEKNTNNLFAGAQYSNLLNSIMFKTNSLVQESQAPALNKHDVMLIAGAQFHTPFVGFQLAVKYGLLDANTGLLPAIGPVNQNKNLRHLAFEFSFIF